jgi:hypothetical protein
MMSAAFVAFTVGLWMLAALSASRSDGRPQEIVVKVRRERASSVSRRD